jgi:exosortase
MTVQSGVFAALAGILVAISPIVPAGPLPSIAGGLAVAACVLGYAALSRRPAGETLATQRRISLPRLSAEDVALLLLAVAVFAPTLAWLYTQWTISVFRNAHGLFIPFLMGWFGWRALRNGAAGESRPSAWGFAFVALGLLLVVADTAIRSRYLASVGLAISLPGFALLLLGAERTRLLTLPLILGLFLIPLPGTAGSTLYLRQATAFAVEPMLVAAGYSITRDGTAIGFPSLNFFVADLCSAISVLHGAAAVAVILAAFSRSRLQRAALLLSVWPLTFFFNSIRIFGLAVLCVEVGPWIMDSPIHNVSAVATFAGVAGSLLLMAGRRTLGRIFA